MKKAILILGAAFVIAGCNQDQGGSSDTYSTGSGSTNAPSSRSSSRNTNAPAMTDTNQSPKSTP
jgi:predicted small secreted protein